MIFSGKSVDKNNKMETRMVINTCNCGCGSELHVTKYVDTDIPNTLTEYYLSLHYILVFVYLNPQYYLIYFFLQFEF